jgi:hypothetical protein
MFGWAFGSDTAKTGRPITQRIIQNHEESVEPAGWTARRDYALFTYWTAATRRRSAGSLAMRAAPIESLLAWVALLPVAGCATEPSPVTSGDLSAIAVRVKGCAQWKGDSSSPWQSLLPGTRLPAGSVIETGSNESGVDIALGNTLMGGAGSQAADAFRWSRMPTGQQANSRGAVGERWPRTSQPVRRASEGYPKGIRRVSEGYPKGLMGRCGGSRKGNTGA